MYCRNENSNLNSTNHLLPVPPSASPERFAQTAQARAQLDNRAARVARDAGHRVQSARQSSDGLETVAGFATSLTGRAVLHAPFAALSRTGAQRLSWRHGEQALAGGDRVSPVKLREPARSLAGRAPTGKGWPVAHCPIGQSPAAPGAEPRGPASPCMCNESARSHETPCLCGPAQRMGGGRPRLAVCPPRLHSLDNGSKACSSCAPHQGTPSSAKRGS